MGRSLAGKTMFVLSDQHYTYEGSPEGGIDPQAEACILQAITQVKPDLFVNIGDVGEWESVSHWKYKRIKRPPLQYQIAELEKEAEAVNAGVDLVDQALKEANCTDKHIIEGNHEAWLDAFCEEHPYLKSQFSPDKIMNLKARGYRYHPYGKYVHFGKLAMYHGGHFASKYHAHQHVTHLGHNIMYGHTHDAQTAKISTLGGVRGAWSIGCVCKLTKAFLKGRPTNWSHNFAIVHFFEKNQFNVEIVEILDGVCHLWGKKVKA